MVSLAPVDTEWLVLLVNGYSPQAQDAAGDDAVPPEHADRDQPALASRATDIEKVQLAEKLWRVFSGPAGGSQVAALDALAATSRLDPHIDAEGHLTWTTPLDGTVDQLTASCTVCLIEAITTYGWGRLGICDGRDCVDVYLDRAGRAPRRYCSAACLNRAKVRAFRARQVAPSTTSPRTVSRDPFIPAQRRPKRRPR